MLCLIFHNIIGIALEDFQVFSFIDYMLYRSTAPRAGPINEKGNKREHEYLIQYVFYTRYSKYKTTKFNVYYYPM